MCMCPVQRLASWLRRTPFHPQWLMPAREVSTAITHCQGRVLDIGAADGWLHAQLDEVAHYISLDYPATAVGLYHTTPKVFADAAALPFGDTSIDAVACYEVMEHVRRPDDVLAEIARVLKPGCAVELTMPFLYPIHDEPHDYQRWTRHRWERALQQVGLSIEMIENRGHSLSAAGVSICLALAAPFQRATRTRLLFALPVLLLALPMVNLSIRLLAVVWPSWEAMPLGYRVLARKPLP